MCTFIIYNSHIYLQRGNITARRAGSFLRRRAKDFISFRETMMRTDKTTLYSYIHDNISV